MRRLLLPRLLLLGPVLIGADWNMRLAADYLDGRQKEWLAWKPAAAPGGTCVSCHTNAPYLMARPALRRALGEKNPTDFEVTIENGLRSRMDKREAMDVFPSFTHEPGSSQAMGVESIHAAYFLPEEKAFERMWETQKKDGGWAWFSLKLDPWAMPDSSFYGAALAAAAVERAPAEYRNRADVRLHLAGLRAYLEGARNGQPLHNRLMLLWTGARAELIEEAFAKQQPTAVGAWSRWDLGNRTRLRRSRRAATRMPPPSPLARCARAAW